MRGSSEAGSRFGTTRWSLVLSVGDGHPGRARDALEVLCTDYWFPLYTFLRRSGRNAEDAADLVQGFFLNVVRRGDLAKVAPEGGRFRSWLVKALRNFCVNADEADRALKRGGGGRVLSLELEEAESRYAMEPADERWTPERLYLRQWALCLLERAHERLREEARLGGREALLERLEPRLTGAGHEDYERIGADLGVAPGTVRVAAHRWRRRLRELVRDEVAQTVDREEDVEPELAALREALG